MQRRGHKPRKAEVVSRSLWKELSAADILMFSFRPPELRGNTFVWSRAAE